MKKLRVYLDTSVIGGKFDYEFAKYSNILFLKFEENIFIPVISTIVLKECEKAPDYVKQVIENLNCQILDLTNEAVNLAKQYLRENIITQKYFDDGLHIAIATVNNIDVLVSWNFKHIVNLYKIREFNAINLKEGYGHIEIRSPLELINE